MSVHLLVDAWLSICAGNGKAVGQTHKQLNTDNLCPRFMLSVLFVSENLCVCVFSPISVNSSMQKNSLIFLKTIKTAIWCIAKK